MKIIQRIVWEGHIGSEQEIFEMTGIYPEMAHNPDNIIVNGEEVYIRDSVVKLEDGTISILRHSDNN